MLLDMHVLRSDSDLEDFQESLLGSLLTYNTLNQEVFWRSLLSCFFLHNKYESFGKFSCLMFLHLVTFCCLNILPFEKKNYCLKLLPYFWNFSFFRPIECFWIYIFFRSEPTFGRLTSRKSSSRSLLPCLLFHDRYERFGKFSYLIFLHLVTSWCLNLLPFFLKVFSKSLI